MARSTKFAQKSLKIGESILKIWSGTTLLRRYSTKVVTVFNLYWSGGRIPRPTDHIVRFNGSVDITRTIGNL